MEEALALVTKILFSVAQLGTSAFQVESDLQPVAQTIVAAIKGETLTSDQIQTLQNTADALHAQVQA